MCRSTPKRSAVPAAADSLQVIRPGHGGRVLPRIFPEIAFRFVEALFNEFGVHFGFVLGQKMGHAVAFLDRVFVPGDDIFGPGRKLGSVGFRRRGQMIVAEAAGIVQRRLDALVQLGKFGKFGFRLIRDDFFLHMYNFPQERGFVHGEQ